MDTIVHRSTHAQSHKQRHKIDKHTLNKTTVSATYNTTATHNNNNDNLTTGPSKSWWEEAKRLLDLAAPLVVVQIGIEIPQMIVTAIMGRRFDPHYLDAIGLGNMVINMFALSFLLGLLMATDTLAPQAYGADNKRQVGILAIRGCFVCMAVVLPINTIICLNLEAISLWMGQPALASRYAADFCRVCLIGIPFNIVYFVGWKFLSAQGIMRPLVVVTVPCFLVILPTSLHFLTNQFWLCGIRHGTGLLPYFPSGPALGISRLVPTI